ncbi:uncharacterized protein LOC5512433 isoform X2 [Nematostella vectensis]|uniref:uncharacterized protein LOC5512433 isoform X2 n=1 Tax=Nematostella vectensis TaxID=45351 RepID=UPI0020773781|nr:uncharacterized protein LOC5512433 isoform X2 [Nematostella vectensis]
MDKVLRPERLETDPNSSTAQKEWLHWKRTFENCFRRILTTPMCAIQMAEKQQSLPSILPPKTLWQGDIDRLCQWIQEKLTEVNQLSSTTQQLSDEVAILEPAGIFGLEGELHVSLIEILHYPQLLFNQKLASLFSKAVEAILSQGDEIAVEEKLPGVYLLLIHPDIKLRRWAERTAQQLGPISLDDYDSISKMVQMISYVATFNQFDNVIQEDNTLLLPSHLVPLSSQKTYWGGICWLLHQFDSETVRVKLLAEQGGWQELPTILVFAIEDHSLKGKQAFWSVLRCLSILLEQYGCRLWSHDFSADKVLDMVTGHPVFVEEILKLQMSACSMFIKKDPDIDCSQSSQSSQSNSCGATQRIALAWFGPFVTSLLDYGDVMEGAVTKVITYLHDLSQQVPRVSFTCNEFLFKMLDIVHILVRKEVSKSLLKQTAEMWANDLVLMSRVRKESVTDRVFQQVVAPAKRTLSKLSSSDRNLKYSIDQVLQGSGSIEEKSQRMAQNIVCFFQDTLPNNAPKPLVVRRRRARKSMNNAWLHAPSPENVLSSSNDTITDSTGRPCNASSLVLSSDTTCPSLSISSTHNRTAISSNSRDPRNMPTSVSKESTTSALSKVGPRSSTSGRSETVKSSCFRESNAPSIISASESAAFSLHSSTGGDIGTMASSQALFERLRATRTSKVSDTRNTPSPSLSSDTPSPASPSLLEQIEGDLPSHLAGYSTSSASSTTPKAVNYVTFKENHVSKEVSVPSPLSSDASSPASPSILGETELPCSIGRKEGKSRTLETASQSHLKTFCGSRKQSTKIKQDMISPVRAKQAIPTKNAQDVRPSLVQTHDLKVVIPKLSPDKIHSCATPAASSSRNTGTHGRKTGTHGEARLSLGSGTPQKRPSTSSNKSANTPKNPEGKSWSGTNVRRETVKQASSGGSFTDVNALPAKVGTKSHPIFLDDDDDDELLVQALSAAQTKISHTDRVKPEPLGSLELEDIGDSDLEEAYNDFLTSQTHLQTQIRSDAETHVRNKRSEDPSVVGVSGVSQKRFGGFIRKRISIEDERDEFSGKTTSKCHLPKPSDCFVDTLETKQIYEAKDDSYPCRTGKKKIDKYPSSHIKFSGHLSKPAPSSFDISVKLEDISNAEDSNRTESSLPKGLTGQTKPLMVAANTHADLQTYEISDDYDSDVPHYEVNPYKPKPERAFSPSALDKSDAPRSFIMNTPDLKTNVKQIYGDLSDSDFDDDDVILLESPLNDIPVNTSGHPFETLRTLDVNRKPGSSATNVSSQSMALKQQRDCVIDQTKCAASTSLTSYFRSTLGNFQGEYRCTESGIAPNAQDNSGEVNNEEKQRDASLEWNSNVGRPSKVVADGRADSPLEVSLNAVSEHIENFGYNDEWWNNGVDSQHLASQSEETETLKKSNAFYSCPAISLKGREVAQEVSAGQGLNYAAVAAATADDGDDAQEGVVDAHAASGGEGTRLGITFRYLTPGGDYLCMVDSLGNSDKSGNLKQQTKNDVDLPAVPLVKSGSSLQNLHLGEESRSPEHSSNADTHNELDAESPTDDLNKADSWWPSDDDFDKDEDVWGSQESAMDSIAVDLVMDSQVDPDEQVVGAIPEISRFRVPSSVRGDYSKAGEDANLQQQPIDDRAETADDDGDGLGNLNKDGSSESGDKRATLTQSLGDVRDCGVPNIDGQSRSSTLPQNQTLNIAAPLVNNRPSASDSLFNKPVAVVTTQSKLTEEDLFNLVLGWEAAWIERPNNTHFPTHCCMIPKTFDSIDHYYEVFKPLIEMEAMEKANKDYNDRDIPKKSLSVTVDSTSRSSRHTLVQCTAMEVPAERVKRNLVAEESDLVIIQADGGFKCLAVVHRMELVQMKQGSTRSDSGDSPSRVYNVTYTLRVRSNFHPLDGVVMEMVYVTSLATTLRQWCGLMHLKNNLLAKDILRPRGKQCFCFNEVPKQVQPSKLFNMSQERVIATAAEAVHQSYALPRIHLTQGPPGTGKSHTIVGIITRILNHPRSCEENRNHSEVFPDKTRLLVCAPSNEAVDELVRKIVRAAPRRDVANKENVRKDRNARDVKNNCGDFVLVRVGRKSHVSPSVKDVCLDNMAQGILKQKDTAIATDNSSNLKTQLRSVHKQSDLLDKEKFYLQDMIQNKGEDDDDEKCELQAQLEVVETKRKALSTQRHALDKQYCQMKHKEAQERRMESRVRKDILNSADIVCCTLSGSGSKKLLNDMRGSTGKKIPFTCVIVDEACQCCEMDILIPLQYRPSKLILVGDPEQLPATVISTKARELLYGRSMFDRLYKFFKVLPRHERPVHLLELQYRMHPEIALFPAEHVYNKAIRNDSSVEKRHFPLQVPYAVFDTVTSSEHNDRKGGIWNSVEVYLVSKMCQKILRLPELTPKSIGIITPYRKQREELIASLRNMGRGCESIEVNTVDGFQGREKDVIIMSCVRAKKGESGIGFVDNRNRLNVSLTRARHALYLVGHLTTLKSSADWSTLIDNARSRRLVYDVHDYRDITDVILDSHSGSLSPDSGLHRNKPSSRTELQDRRPESQSSESHRRESRRVHVRNSRCSDSFRGNDEKPSARSDRRDRKPDNQRGLKRSRSRKDDTTANAKRNRSQYQRLHSYRGSRTSSRHRELCLPSKGGESRPDHDKSHPTNGGESRPDHDKSQPSKGGESRPGNLLLTGPVSILKRRGSAGSADSPFKKRVRFFDEVEEANEREDAGSTMDAANIRMTDKESAGESCETSTLLARPVEPNYDTQGSHVKPTSEPTGTSSKDTTRNSIADGNRMVVDEITGTQNTASSAAKLSRLKTIVNYSSVVRSAPAKGGKEKSSLLDSLRSESFASPTSEEDRSLVFDSNRPLDDACSSTDGMTSGVDTSTSYTVGQVCPFTPSPSTADECQSEDRSCINQWESTRRQPEGSSDSRDATEYCLLGSSGDFPRKRTNQSQNMTSLPRPRCKATSTRINRSGVHSNDENDNIIKIAADRVRSRHPPRQGPGVIDVPQGARGGRGGRLRCTSTTPLSRTLPVENEATQLEDWRPFGGPRQRTAPGGDIASVQHLRERALDAMPVPTPTRKRSRSVRQQVLKESKRKKNRDSSVLKSTSHGQDEYKIKSPAENKEQVWLASLKGRHHGDKLRTF